MSLFFAAAVKSDPNIARSNLFDVATTFAEARDHSGPSVDQQMQQLQAKSESYRNQLKATTHIENNQKQRSYEHIINVNDKIVGRSLPLQHVTFEGLAALPKPRAHPLDELTAIVRNHVAEELARDAQLTDLRARGCLNHVHFQD